MAAQLIRAAADPAASHNCYAYRIGEERRSSDDGEPGGSAGRPMLSAIEAEGLDGVCVLVVRHFGGIKLGAGGLARAYGGAARQCLQEAPRTFCEAKVFFELDAPFELMGCVYTALERLKADRVKEDYAGGEGVALMVSVSAAGAQQLVGEVTDATSGRVVPRPLSSTASGLPERAHP